MTLEWPAAEHPSEHATSHAVPSPVNQHLVVLAVLAVAMLAALALVPGALSGLLLVVGYPLEFLVMVVVAILLVSAVADVVAGWWEDVRSPAGRVLLRAVEGGGDPVRIAERLRAMDVPEGRARLCRDVAVRCLEGAARFGRLEGRLRREAAGWTREMIKEMKS